MTELERTLRELGRELEYPPTPDLAPAVRRRLAARPARRWTWPRAAAIAFAMLVAGAAAVLAVPPARSAVLDWLGIGGVSIERVSTLPPARATGLELGRLVPLAEARELVDYEIVLPDVEGGRPERVYFALQPPGGQVALLLEGEGGGRVLFTEFPGSNVATKAIGPGTRVEDVRVDGHRGLWIAGEAHTFMFQNEHGESQGEEPRLAGNVLLWERDGLTLRLEGDLTKERALEIAETVD